MAVSHQPQADHVRVLEAYLAPPGAPTADLALSERELPEVLSILHQVDEVHVHGMPLELALNLIPYVRPEVLEATPLYLHGPWPELVRSPRYDATRLQSWPGPIHYDPAGAATPEAKGTLPTTPTRLWIDPSEAALLPRAGGAVPHSLDTGRGCVCALSADLDDELRTQLAIELTRLSSPRLRVEPLDESLLPPSQRAGVRRVTQVAIVDAGTNPATLALTATLEAIAQGLPLVCVGDPPSDAPSGVTWIPRSDAKRTALACIDAMSPWLPAWHDGRSAMDTTASRDWLVARACHTTSS
ncbi:MAG: hypothetical protein B7733_14480 [Myxococcales bacterium FL481]|nr:MAG: hypothetical protein B7733_14480 [Myxococcales bacterium FL481]